MANNPYVDQYRKNAVLSANTLQLIIMLYDAAIRFLDTGMKAMKEKNYYDQNTNYQKVQKILIELISSLDEESAGEMGANLKNIYIFLYDSMVKANIEDDYDLSVRCRKIIVGLRNTWYELEKREKQKKESANHQNIDSKQSA